MARPSKPGILYFSLDTDQCLNTKVRLLFNEFGGDGFWIYHCLLGRIYSKQGYYFNNSDKDALELFATDVCNRTVSLVEEVVAGCVRRLLFDKRVSDMFGILTSDRIQQNYLDATANRRRKGIVIEFIEEYLLIEKVPHPNVVYSTLQNSISESANNEEIRVPTRRNSPKVKESKVKKIAYASAEQKSAEPPEIFSDGNKTSNKKKNKISGAAPEQIPASTSLPPSPSLRGGGTTTKQSPALNGKPEKEVIPYWKPLVATWFTFHEEKKLLKPSFKGADPRELKSICEHLQKRVTDKGNYVWDEINAPTALRKFLDRAWNYDDNGWLRKHFLLSNLNNQFDAIINTHPSKNGNINHKAGSGKIIAKDKFPAAV